ncbi:MAG TPA: ion channel [Caulobacteraceae bacterium]|nr:ion channel [Caulobacteraceae bacterium]
MADGAENEGQVRYPRMGGDALPPAIFIGHAKDGWKDAYHFLLTMPLAAFFATMGAAYLGVNALFALLYMLVGGIDGVRPGDFPDAFFFSVQTLGTIGYGQMSPRSLGAEAVVTVESFFGLFELAIATGLLFARISRPTARVMFSDLAVVTPHEGVPTLMFRAANRRRNRIVEAEVSVNLARDGVTLEGARMRGFESLATIRSRSPVFVLTWQIMHRIDETSPLFGQTTESLIAQRAEIVVILKGLDETFAQTIHARASYTPDEIIWGARLVDVFSRDADGRPVIDYTRFHDIDGP